MLPAWTTTLKDGTVKFTVYIAGKPHPNSFEAVKLFKSEQATTEINMQQLASGGATSARRKYRLKEKG